MSAAGAPVAATSSESAPAVPNSEPRPPNAPAPPATSAITAAQATTPIPPATRATDPAKVPCTVPIVGRVARRGRGFRDRWRQSFVLSITLVALLAVAVFALVIGRVVASQIEDQALNRARETAGIVARASFAPRLPAQGKRLASADRADLDRQLTAARAQEPGLVMRLWGAGGTVVYGPPANAPSAAVRAALRGRAATDVQRDG